MLLAAEQSDAVLGGSVIAPHSRLRAPERPPELGK